MDIKKYLAWIAGGFTFIFSLVYAANSDILSAVFFLFSTLLIFPQTFNILDNLFKNKLSNNGLRLLIVIVTFFIGIAVSPSDNTFTPEKNSLETSIKEATLENENINSNKIVNDTVGLENDSKKESGKVVKVSDGDTIRVRVDNEEISVRLIGIDTPELHHQSEPIQCYGPEAKEALEDLILDKEVVLEKDVSDVDKYDRYLRYVWLDEILVNEYMAQKGYAFSSSYPPDTKYQDRISAAEKNAKNSSIGLWSIYTCNGNVYTGTYKDPNKVVEPVPVIESNNTVTSPSPSYVAPPAPAPSTKNSSYTCDCSKTCGQMSSCDEAYYQLNVCGCSVRDGDNDGIPCESICN